LVFFEMFPESIVRDPTLIFSWSCRPQRVLSASICPL
jgi:hypothetical protein